MLYWSLGGESNSRPAAYRTAGTYGSPMHENLLVFGIPKNKQFFVEFQGLPDPSLFAVYEAAALPTAQAFIPFFFPRVFLSPKEKGLLSHRGMIIVCKRKEYKHSNYNQI